MGGDTKQAKKNETLNVVPSVESKSCQDAAYNINLLCQLGIDLKCAECGINPFMFHDDFANHMAIKHGISKPYRCPEIGCDRKYGRRDKLITHIKRDHQKKRNYECDECHKQFYSKGNWKTHCRIHREEREFKCQLCDGAYKQRSALLSHIKQVHEKIRNYQCAVCHKYFYKRSHWESHCHIHGDERAFKCEHCDKAFKRKRTLRDHIRNVHEKTFYFRRKWKSHCRIHGDKREFECGHCDKAFKQKGGLHNHIKKVHEKIRNHQCDVCGKAFYSKAAWLNHTRIHTGEKPFNCSKCGKCFSLKAYRNVHERKHCHS